ncbi:ABC transporter transmembrane domain-containing protein [Prochlorococcus marinus]|uniref:ABC transporter transmembrane domain-containing protein n=1 Tax=Prochlorococcus marinus TaxID=1219 RepID=UPI001ADBD6A6|nr:ABC transporter transmembrane domain-containing protein [Prochlorococcus marinus]MBO8216990.1 ATP-binding cassette domain-containing protein [Prochlorococcus marinus XMU1405]MBW3040223.1 type I secretion system permease/ATPase [Prochlorococcus marinus str. MU1405]MBW3047681.1 type I secretion system permease/ATPase [Prochlorococcus marinus str. MU1406]
MKNNLYSSWEDLLINFDKDKLSFSKNIKLIKIPIGKKFTDIGSLPCGVLLVKKGRIREISFDENEKPFTTKIYNKGEFVGSEHLLRGENSIALTASSNVEGTLLEAEAFINFAIKNPKFLEYFSTVSTQEIFYSLKKDSKFTEMEYKQFQNYLDKVKYQKKIINIYPESSLDGGMKGKYLVSSCNLRDYKIGQIVQEPKNLVIKGKLPARLIPLTFDLPESKKIKISETFVKDQISDKRLQIEALQDIYGSNPKTDIFPDCRGEGKIEELLALLRMICRFYEIPFKKDFLKKILKNQLEESQFSLDLLAAVINLIGLKTIFLNPEDKDQILRIPTPSIFIKNQKPLIIWEIVNDQLLIGDPNSGQSYMETDDLSSSFKDGIKILYAERTRRSPKNKFGLGWFWPSIKKHKISLIQVVIASFFVQLLALLNPLLIQQIIDAVISQGNFSSLNILGGLLIFLAFGQAILGSLRTYLFSDTTNRIDISLGSSIISHLLRLPLDYFAKRSVGEVSGRVGELEKIRSFLTGTALSVLLDSIFSVIYIAVLLSYSVQLTIWALGVLPIFVALTIFISPVLRDQLRKKAEASAKVNSHMVESLSGIETIKAQNMELSSEWKWEKMYSMQVKEGFRNTITNTAASSASNFLQQLSGLIIIWAGAAMVLQGKLTLGQLIAFRIISSYVTSPLLRLASLWQSFQETSISLERLSDIVDHPEEIEIMGDNLPPMPPINGDIVYENVNFRFGSNGPYQLLNINLKIKKNSFIGFVGSSGSGKSTVLKLLTRLYEPNSGFIKIDSHDVSKVDLYSLRNQIGVVPQDSILFDGTIQDNISLTKPEVSYEEVICASKIACAHEFIEKFPSGYANYVGERGTGLSGGQRQRIAIARVILTKPKLLILDEATSALDVDTEKRLLKNLLQNFKDTTILFISHRLSNLRNANNIFVLDDGTIVEEGDHSELIKLNGRYATLYKQQEVEI